MDTYKILMGFSIDELSNLVLKLLNKLNEKDRTNFISKYISAKIALNEVGESCSDKFLQEVQKFCDSCLNGEYYSDPEADYDYNDYDYYDGDNSELFESSEWAKNFSEYLRITGMYLRNKDYETAYKSFTLIMDCLHKAEFDEEIFGTEDPMTYIDANWKEVFDEYYLALKHYESSEKEMTEKSIDIWIDFGVVCTESVLKQVDNIELAENVIRKNIKTIETWKTQHLLYDMLEKFYTKFDKAFDRVKVAKSLIEFNKNFYNDVAKGYYDLGMWNDVINTVNEALPQMEQPEVIFSLNQKLVDSYENLQMFGQALDVAVKMFYEKNAHELYKRARFLAEKIGDVNKFIDNIEQYLHDKKDNYNSTQTLINVLSFEGRIEKLIDVSIKDKGYSRHNYLKYTSKSLIFRAIGSDEIKLPNIKDYIESIKQDGLKGIVDMLKFGEDATKKEYCLNYAVDVLKIMVQFHIDAATRTRYARAAYYCSVMMDIYKFLNKEADFRKYYTTILYENNRRPALKDEMKRRIGNC